MLAIFLEPKGSLRNFIVRWKSKIMRKNLETEYIKHPPHCTIYVSNLINQQKVIKEIFNVTNEFKSFTVKINKTGIFLNDKFTGKDTIYLNIKKNKNIYVLQKKLANRLKGFSKNKNFKQHKFFNKQMKKNFVKYGFPFVGSHWKPHFTIGSIKKFKNDIDYLIFKKKKVSFELEVKSLSLWKISKKKHKKLKDFYLKKND